MMERDNRVGILIHFYSDVPTENVDSAQPITELHVQEDDLPPVQPHKTETLIWLACKRLGIGPVGFYLFGIQALNNEPGKHTGPDIWIPPNKPFEYPEDKLVHYQLRIRFIPSMAGIRALAGDSRPTLDFFFLQCRTDFLSDKIRIGSNIKQEHRLGLAVIDKLRWGKEHDLDLHLLKTTKPWKFIPQSSNKQFKMIWDKKRLSMNFNSKLDELSNQNDKQVIDHKLRYINGIMNYSEQYGVEKFEIVLDVKDVMVVVDPQHEKFHGIYTIPKGCKEENEEKEAKLVCKIEDVMSVSLSKLVSDDESKKGTLVTICRKHEGHPKTLCFPSEESALSFMALVDGYYRLTEDFHGQVSSDVSSPMLRELARYKSFGPISHSWAENKLIEKSEQEKSINYIMMQDPKSLEKYIILFISQRNNEIKRVSVVKTEEGRWRFVYKDSPAFPSMMRLLEHYRSNSNDEPIKLNRYVNQTGQFDMGLYLCRANLSNSEDKDKAKTQVRSQVTLVSRIDQRAFEYVGKGHFTEVFKFMYEKEANHLQRVAVKGLQSDKSEYLESFTKSMNNLSFWKCPTIISAHTICLYPFRVVMDYAELGDLAQYIRRNSATLSAQHLVTAAEQISQALLYLQEYGDMGGGDLVCHGNIRCSNVFVFAFDEVKGPAVKLGDSGMIDVYSKLPLRNKINEERIPWVAPELIDEKLQREHSVQFADIYSFGVFLWEVFSGAQRPFGDLALRPIISRVLHSDGLGPPAEAPVKIKNLVKRCLNVNGAERPTAKEIVQTIWHTQTDVYHNPDIFPIGHQYALPHEDESEIEVMDSLTIDTSHLSVKEKERRVEHLLNLQSMVPFQQQQSVHGPLITSSGGSTLSDSIPQSPTNISGPWDSTTPLIKQTSINAEQSESLPDVSADTSRASQDTTTTELDENNPPVTAIPPPQLRPLPPVPVSVVQQFSIDDSVIIDPDRVVINTQKSLGKGHYGEVYPGTYKMYNGETKQVAVKSLKQDKFEKYKKEFVKEIQMMTELSHPHVVDIIGQTEPDDHRLLLVMEFVENGCLRDYLSKERAQAKSNTAELDRHTSRLVRYAREMTEAMVYLSDKSIVHRDLAARNVLVTIDDHLKISDFGLARLLKEKDYYAMSDRKQEIPAFWCAPEALEHRKFTTKTDVWSLGVTFWETFSFGKTPNLGVKVAYLLYYLGPAKQYRLKKESLYSCPDSMYVDIMTNCWRYYPEERPTFKQILQKVKEIEDSLSRD